jgi:glycerol kinase
VWPSREEISRSFRVGKRFEPRMKAEERERHLAKWRRAVAAA